MKTKYLSLLLAVVLCFGLATSAFAYSYRGFEYTPDNSTGSMFTQNSQGNTSSAGDAYKYYEQSNSNLFSIAYWIDRNFGALKSDSYLWDQGYDGQLVPMHYAAYALHGLKGTIRNSGTFLSFYPGSFTTGGVQNLGSDSKDYFYSNWRNIFSSLTSTAANGWTIYTMSDNAAPSWLYQLAHHTAQSGISMETLMNWGVDKYIDGARSPESTSLGTNSWFGKVQTALNQQTTGISSILTQLRNSNMDTSGLATESTLSSFKSQMSIFPDFVDNNLSILSDIMVDIRKFKAPFVVDKYNFNDYSIDSDGNLLMGAGSNFIFPKALLNTLSGHGVELFAINSNLLKLDEILATENDRALEDATDDTKVTVKDYVSDKKSNFGDSFTVGSTVADGLKPDLSTAQASSAVSGLFSPDSGDYWGWFSSSTDSDLHPGASSVATVSLDSEPSAQDVADSETVWVINPYASSSDLISDFFGGE